MFLDVVILALTFVQSISTTSESQSALTARPYVISNPICPNFTEYNSPGYAVSIEPHIVTTFAECESHVHNLTGGLNPIKVFDASTLRAHSLDFLNIPEAYLFPCGCYLYNGPQSDGIYDFWTSRDSSGTVRSAPTTWKVGSNDSYVFAFFSSGTPTMEEVEPDHSLSMCTMSQQNVFSSQLEWGTVCDGKNPLDSCSCDQCFLPGQDNCFALNVDGGSACDRDIVGAGSTKSCCTNLNCNVTSCIFQTGGNCFNHMYNVNTCRQRFGECLSTPITFHDVRIPNLTAFQIAEGTSCEQYGNSRELNELECAHLAILHHRSYIINEDREFVFDRFVRGCVFLSCRHIARIHSNVNTNTRT